MNEETDVVWDCTGEAPSPNLLFWCPGCECAHGVRVGGPQDWKWNGDRVKPTLSPSVKVTFSEFTEKGERDYQAWRAGGCPPLPKDFRFEGEERVCHSFVRNGVIEFLGDCHHRYANQHLPLSPWKAT